MHDSDNLEYLTCIFAFYLNWGSFYNSYKCPANYSYNYSHCYHQYNHWIDRNSVYLQTNLYFLVYTIVLYSQSAYRILNLYLLFHYHLHSCSHRMKSCKENQSIAFDWAEHLRCCLHNHQQPLLYSYR